MDEEYAMEDATQLLDSSSDFACYPGVQNEASVKEFLYRFPLPVIINALQTKSDMPGLENALVACLERVFKTKYGASLIPQYMPFVQVGLRADSQSVRCLACKTVTCLLENFDEKVVSPVHLVINNGIYPLLLDCLINGNEQVANAAADAIQSFASFPDALSVIFPSDTDEATSLGKLAKRCSSLGRVRVLSLIVKLFSVSTQVASAIHGSKLLDLLEAEIKNTNDTLVILSVLELFYELAEIENGTEFLSRTTLLQLLFSLISNAPVEKILRSRAMMISGRLLSKENVYKYIDEPSVKALISAIARRLESPESQNTDEYESAIEAFGQIGSTTQGANYLISTSPPAARHVVAAAFDRQGSGKQLAALHALANIVGETRSENNIILSDEGEESLQHLIYDVAANSTKLTPSGLFLSVFQQPSEFRLAGYRMLTGLVVRLWCLTEICSREEIINVVIDPTSETTKIGMEARYNCCKAIHKAFLSSKFSSDPACAQILEKLQEAVRNGPYLVKKYQEAQPAIMTAERF